LEQYDQILQFFTKNSIRAKNPALCKFTVIEKLFGQVFIRPPNYFCLLRP